MPDANLAGISRRSRSSTRPSRYWIITVDSPKLREALTKRDLSLGKLAAEAGVSVRTIARLKNGQATTCHRATLYRIAAALADNAEAMFSALAAPEGIPHTRGRLASACESTASWICSRVFAARPDQVAEARAFLGRVLHGCPMAYDAEIVCSELFTNSLRHSMSSRPGGRVLIRAEVCEYEYIWLEVEDQGGAWTDGSQADEGGRGLEVVAALSDYWDIRSREARRMVCARIDWPQYESSDGI